MAFEPTNGCRRLASGWRSPWSRILVCLLLPFLVGACQSRPDRPDRGTFRGIVYSPNGEPLSGGSLGHAGCPEAMERWFHRVDQDHRGVITEDEYLADARRQFAVMDLDHDGFVTPFELSEYRRPFEPPLMDPDRESRRDRGHPPDDRGGGGPSDQLRSVDTPDPVMSADRGLNFRVSGEDFDLHAKSVFHSLDKDRKGAVTLDQVKTLCRSKRGEEPR